MLKTAVHLPFNRTGGSKDRRKTGVIMRVLSIAAFGFSAFAATPAGAATIVVLTNPETMERKTVVVDESGPDRIFVCMLPPGEAGCHQVKMRRRN